MPRWREVEAAEEQGGPANQGPPVLVCLLGSFRLLKVGRLVNLRPGGKAETLLATLALRPKLRVPRDTLLEILWPDTSFPLAMQSLNTLIYSLGKLLSEAIDGAAPVLHPNGSYQLNLAAGIGIDMLAFDEAARSGLQHERNGREAEALDAFRRAVDLYAGDLYPVGDAHAVVERERLRAVYHTLLARLAEYQFDQRAYGVALDHALRLLGSDATREDAHRMAMRCYVRRGERAQALRQYRLCERVLRAEFDARPEPATTSLFERVRHDPGSV